ncbi:TIGR01777 family protein [candidate division KSB1 bacterium]|nr:MAG: TIGR01777 family protein [candidate division KSB1 bacterium]
MKIIITGASGFIGRHLAVFFSNRGYDVVALSRNPQTTQKLFDSRVKCLPFVMGDPAPWLSELQNTRILINLIGENIGTHLWTKAYRQRLRSSRVESVLTILKALEKVKPASLTYIQASAVGYYGNTALPVDEQGSMGADFLARLTYDWERATDAIAEMGIRRLILRFGVILGRTGGALPRLLMPYKFFLGGVMGSGRQGFSWMHIEDLERAMEFLINNEPLQGVFNFVAPNPVSQKELSQTIAALLHRPDFFRIPAWPLKFILGDMAEILLLGGQYVKPAALLSAGFEFKYPELRDALNSLLREQAKTR